MTTQELKHATPDEANAWLAGLPFTPENFEELQRLVAFFQQQWQNKAAALRKQTQATIALREQTQRLKSKRSR